MKSGTGDDPFADPFEEDESDDQAAVDDEPESATDTDTSETSDDAAEADTIEVDIADSVSTEVPSTDDTGNAADADDVDHVDDTDSAGDADGAGGVDDTADADTETATPSGEPSSANATDAQSSGASAGAEKPDDSHIPWVLRRSSVKDDRPNITQFFLRDETDRGERALRSDVEQILDKDVYTLDLREAAYLVAMEHPEEVAETLRDWGYDYLD